MAHGLYVLERSDVNPKEFIHIQETPVFIDTKERYKGKTVFNTNKALERNGLFMPTLPLFVLHYRQIRDATQRKIKLFDGAGEELDRQRINLHLNLLHSNYGTWLDAYFSQWGNKMYVTYHAISPDGQRSQRTELLEDCLMKPAIPVTKPRKNQISLDEWLNNSTNQGLPKPTIKEGTLRYVPPGHDSVARFCTGYIGLDCDEDPDFFGSPLGVHSCVIGTPAVPA